MAEIQDLSTTDASNTGAAANAGFPENMNPSDVNNAARALEGMIARLYADTNGSIITTGSGNAYVLAAARTIASYAQGQVFMFEANHTNTGASTLNVDSVGAKAIVKHNDTALAAGDLEAGQICFVAYEATGDNFQMLSPPSAVDADILKADTADELTAGFSSATVDAGTKSSGTFTPDPDAGNFQHFVNGGAHTLAPPSKNCTMVLLMKNNASAGTLTTSGFTLVDGDSPPATTNGHEFFCYLTRYNDGSTTFSALTIKALQ
tara:strand:+ start:419 stop:1207 length:789 start_codon:yes stop_codon:yes gene_type:complete